MRAIRKEKVSDRKPEAVVSQIAKGVNRPFIINMMSDRQCSSYLFSE